MHEKEAPNESVRSEKADLCERNTFLCSLPAREENPRSNLRTSLLPCVSNLSHPPQSPFSRELQGHPASPSPAARGLQAPCGDWPSLHAWSVWAAPVLLFLKDRGHNAKTVTSNFYQELEISTKALNLTQLSPCHDFFVAVLAHMEVKKKLIEIWIDSS